jgi:hypothetical protein
MIEFLPLLSCAIDRGGKSLAFNFLLEIFTSRTVYTGSRPNRVDTRYCGWIRARLVKIHYVLLSGNLNRLSSQNLFVKSPPCLTGSCIDKMSG